MAVDLLTREISFGLALLTYIIIRSILDQVFSYVDSPIHPPNPHQVKNDPDSPAEDPSMRADMGVAALAVQVSLLPTVQQHWDRVLSVNISPHMTLSQALYQVRQSPNTNELVLHLFSFSHEYLS